MCAVTPLLFMGFSQRASETHRMDSLVRHSKRTTTRALPAKLLDSMMYVSTAVPHCCIRGFYPGILHNVPCCQRMIFPASDTMQRTMFCGEIHHRLAIGKNPYGYSPFTVRLLLGTGSFALSILPRNNYSSSTALQRRSRGNTRLRYPYISKLVFSLRLYRTSSSLSFACPMWPSRGSESLGMMGEAGRHTQLW